jgi:predicted RNase H-like nuclease (RuvC/YqgF family)
MGKVLLYASIAVTAATLALGLINKGKMSGVKDQLGTAQQEVQQKTSSLEQSQKSLKEAKDTLTTTVAEKEQATAQLETVKTEAEKNKSQVTDLTSQVTTKETKISELTAQIEEDKKKIETLTSGQTAAPAAGPSAEDQAKMQEQETLIAKLQGDLDSSRTQLEELRKDKANRTAGLMRKGLEGRILAVNQAWNFVVLNLGDRNGVVGNAEMLIKRGNQLIGRVRVTSVEPSTSIADIVASSVPRGVSIQPGDNVIYQATAE